jgi:hypothetical protein
LALAIALTLGVGCSQGSHGKLKTLTEVELDRLIVPGMSAAEVINRFGPAESATEIDPSVSMWIYSFPLQPEKSELHLAGFSIYVKDGKVAKWSPIMEESRQTLQAGRAQGSSGEQSFQIVLATASQSNLIRMVDSEGVADANTLDAPTQMTVRAKVFSGNSRGEVSGEQTVILVVTEDDALKLKNLTQDNFGKRLLIVCRNKVIAAPLISAPIASRQLMFTVKDSSVLSVLGM